MKKQIILALSFSSLFLVPALVFAGSPTGPGGPDTPDALPEPAGLFLIAAGLIGVWGFRKIFKN